MKRIIPDDIYQGLPCSVTAVGCALGISNLNPLSRIVSGDLREDGYLSLRGMERLLKSNLGRFKRHDYRRGARPLLRDWAREHKGIRAVICVLGHFIYFDGRDYHSFFWNGGDEVVAVWELED